MSRLPTVSLALALCALAPASAVGASGGAGVGGTGSSPGGGTTPTATDSRDGGTATGSGGSRDGGTAVGTAHGGSTGAGSRSRSRVPVLSAFDVRGTRFYSYGSPPRVSFQVDGRGRMVRLRIGVYSGGRRVRLIDLGDRNMRVKHSVALRGPLPEGAVQLRITGTDSAGHKLRSVSGVSRARDIEVHGHRFPLVGIFTFGGAGSRYGAGRGGRLHQGQDISAAEGTPVVAPRGGTVSVVAYQAGGAGNYIVLKAAGEARSYVFMHLQTGTTRVRVGQTVRTGTQLARVGSTGSATGPHLHFEIWVGGPWMGGGHTIDPLPELRLWDSWS